MSEAPRWPGADGSPGLDFSDRRSRAKDGAGPTGTSTAVRPSGSSSAAPARTSNSAPAPSSKVDVPSRGDAPQRSKPASATSAPRTTVQSTGGPVVTAPVKAPAAGSPSASASPSAAPKAERAAAARGARRTRKARLRLARIDPWSVMKTAFLFSIASGVMIMIGTAVVWQVFESSGAIGELNNFLATLLSQEGGEKEFRVDDYLNGSRVLGFAAIVAAIDVVILTAVATLFAFLYNLAATVIGGLEVTLAED